MVRPLGARLEPGGRRADAEPQSRHRAPLELDAAEHRRFGRGRDLLVPGHVMEPDPTLSVLRAAERLVFERHLRKQDPGGGRLGRQLDSLLPPWHLWNVSGTHLSAVAH